MSGFAITASLVVDQNGNSVSTSGSSKGIGNATDLELLIALRRKSQLILTSGITYRQEVCKMPKSADLAVFSRNPVDFSVLDIPAGSKATWIGPDKAGNYHQALDACHDLGYKRIHIEFGERGIIALYEHKRIDALVISSVHPDGLERFFARVGFLPSVRTQINGLSLGLVAWQQ